MDLPQRKGRKLQIENCKLKIVNCRVLNFQFAFFILHFAILLFGLLGRDVLGSGVDVTAEAPQVVPVDAAAFAAKLVSVGADGVATFQPADATNAVGIKLVDLVRWGNPAPLKPQTIVVLADGGRIVTAADWSGGAAVRLQGDELAVLSDLWNEVRMPRQIVSGIVFAQRSRAAEREKLVERVRTLAGVRRPPNAASTDALAVTLALTNGNEVGGTLLKLERGSLTLRVSSEETTLPLSRVESIVFDTPTDVPHDAGTQLFVGMRDGSLLLAQSVTADMKRVTVSIFGKVILKGGTVEDIALLQSLGGRFEYLSNMESLDYHFVPYLTMEWPLARDRNVLGGPLMVNSLRSLKGLGMHSAARVTCRFEREFQRFDAAVAIDDAAQGRGSVMFAAHVLRDGKWVEAFKSKIIRGGEGPLPVSVDLGGTKGITLTVDYADRGDELDYADWLEARLVK